MGIPLLVLQVLVQVVLVLVFLVLLVHLCMEDCTFLCSSLSSNCIYSMMDLLQNNLHMMAIQCVYLGILLVVLQVLVQGVGVRVFQVLLVWVSCMVHCRSF